MNRISLNEGWLFGYGDTDILDKREFFNVDIPYDFIRHTNRTADSDGFSGNGYFGSGMGEYIKTFCLEPVQNVWLMIDGAYMNAEVYVNKTRIILHHYGYTPIFVDISRYVRFDCENELRIIVQSRQPSSRWYSGGGLYRDVSLYTANGSYINPWEVYVRCTSADALSATIKADYKISGEASASNIELLDRDKKTVANKRVTPKTDNNVEISIDGPHLWSVDDPYLYTLRITLENGDVYYQNLGIRVISINTDEGFQLNGKSIKLRGGCLHHDNGPLGAESYLEAEERKIFLLKSVGYNAVRCAHNPPSQLFLEACDRLGMLVMDEAFDCWNEGKNPLDYHLYFQDDWAKDTAAMVFSARNHACVFAYSIGNEIPERDGHGDGAIWARKIAEQIKTIDPDRPVTCAVNGLQRPGKEIPFVPQYGKENLHKLRFWDPQDDYWGKKTEEFCAPLDFVGYNYMQFRYEFDAQKYPTRPIVCTESFPAMTYEFWQKAANNKNVCGDFIWTAFDYLGEAGIGRAMYEDDPDRRFPAG